MFVKSSGLEYDEDKCQKWSAQRVLIKGLVLFAECFCIRNKFSRVQIFKTLASVFISYAQQVENSHKKEPTS